MGAVNGSAELMCNQARRAMVAYAHGQLGAAARRRLELHVRTCGACRAALDQEQRLAAEIRREMPHIGQPRPGQLKVLWPTVRAQIASPVPGLTGADRMSVRRLKLNPVGGLALVSALMCAFLVSMMMYTPASAVGAPLPPVPADIQAMPTPFTTLAPGADMAETARPAVSRTATLAPSLPNAPAAPETLMRTLGAPDDAER